MAEDSDWGPWVEHDGKGCPVDLMNRYIQAQFELSCEDEEGGGPGDIRTQEALMELRWFNNPMWRWENFGQRFVYTSGPHVGREFEAGRVLRYRIRKDRSIELMKAKAAALDCVSPRVLEDG